MSCYFFSTPPVDSTTWLQGGIPILLKSPFGQWRGKKNRHRAEILLADGVRLLCVNVVSCTLLNLLLWVHHDHKMWNMKAWGMPQWPNSSWALEYDVLRWTTEKKIHSRPLGVIWDPFCAGFCHFPVMMHHFCLFKAKDKAMIGFQGHGLKAHLFLKKLAPCWMKFIE